MHVLGVSLGIHMVRAHLLISEDLENSHYIPLTGESDEADGKSINSWIDFTHTRPLQLITGEHKL